MGVDPILLLTLQQSDPADMTADGYLDRTPDGMIREGQVVNALCPQGEVEVHSLPMVKPPC
jgi:hypothetical protein